MPAKMSRKVAWYATQLAEAERRAGRSSAALSHYAMAIEAYDNLPQNQVKHVKHPACSDRWGEGGGVCIWLVAMTRRVNTHLPHYTLPDPPPFF